ncbi:MAG: pseudouridine synthase [Lachnospiraceae bacterium]|nr:pseudouridine synthase [Lachnospiraceae bacterium]
MARINKFLSEAGVCSRRAADKLIDEGRVLVNGELPEKGASVSEEDVITVDGKPVKLEKEEIVIAFNKPVGLVCTAGSKENGKRVRNVIDYINYPKRIYPVGRLDKDSEGLLLLTNQGELTNRILKSRFGHEKEYYVETNKTITDDMIKRMSEGVKIYDEEKSIDTVTKPCSITRAGDKSFRIILKQGINRQIRRMCESEGLRVILLRRERVMNIELSDLKKGEYRPLTDKELLELKRECGLNG